MWLVDSSHFIFSFIQFLYRVIYSYLCIELFVHSLLGSYILELTIQTEALVDTHFKLLDICKWLSLAAYVKLPTIFFLEQL